MPTTLAEIYGWILAAAITPTSHSYTCVDELVLGHDMCRGAHSVLVEFPQTVKYRLHKLDYSVLIPMPPTT
jgi:hypothetical protein